MTKDKLLLDKIKKQINKAKVVSFDIFDTLLVRPYIHPTDLFEHMGKAYERPGFAAERKDAERRTRIRHKELEDVTFDMIYDEIDDEFKDMKQKEMAWEKMVLRLNPELKQVYDYALKQGKKVIITSDMYLSTEFLAKVLRKNGFDNWDKLYVSGDVGKKKGTGTLYCKLLEDMEEKADNILHIGDNKNSDVDVPQKLGIKTVLYEQVALQFLATHQTIRVFRKQTMGQLDSSILVAIFAYRWQQERCGAVEKRSYWQNLGFQYAGPIAYGYCRFIEKKAKEEGIDNLLFVARDGYTLQEIFKKLNININNNYIYGPRLIRQILTQEFDNLKDIKYVCQFYETISSEFQRLLQEKKPVTSEDYKHFFDENKKLIEEISSILKVEYKNYIKEYINKNANNTAIVDSMTSYFSTQKLLLNYADNIYAFYFGLYKLINDSKKYRYSIYSKPSIISRNVALFVEFLLASPEYPIQWVKSDGKVIYSSVIDKHEVYRSHIYKQIIEGALEFVDDIIELFTSHTFLLQPEITLSLLNNYLNYPQLDDLENMSNIYYSRESAHINYEPLFVKKIKFKEIFTSCNNLIKNIKSLPWKTPFQKFLLYKIYYKYKDSTKTYIKLFGYEYFVKIKNKNEKVKKIFFGLFTKKRNSKSTIIRILGLPIYKKYEKQLYIKKKLLGICFSKEISYSSIKNIVTEQINRSIIYQERTDYLVKAQKVHSKTFSEYFNKYQDRDISLVACGPTSLLYKPQLNSITVGVNSSIYFKDIQLDHLFMQDIPINRIDKKSMEIDNDIKKYEGNNCKKFYGIISDARLKYLTKSIRRIPPQNLRLKNTSFYYLSPIYKGNFAYDLSTDLIADWAGTVFSAMQFIFYTNPKRIFLIGCDCSNGHAFKTPEAFDLYNTQKQGWLKVKEFRDNYYPNTEIISVNPVGLKGVFRDVYTKEYLHKHPEINSDGLEILEDGEIK